jgi:hypothetical protein
MSCSVTAVLCLNTRIRRVLGIKASNQQLSPEPRFDEQLSSQFQLRCFNFFGNEFSKQQIPQTTNKLDAARKIVLLRRISVDGFQLVSLGCCWQSRSDLRSFLTYTSRAAR